MKKLFRNLLIITVIAICLLGIGFQKTDAQFQNIQSTFWKLTSGTLSPTDASWAVSVADFIVTGDITGVLDMNGEIITNIGDSGTDFGADGGLDLAGNAVVRTATKVVCANGIDDTVQCDEICDGTLDNVQIQAAIDALPAGGGSVYLTEGTFNIGVSIDNDSKDYISIVGSGIQSTILELNDNIDDYVIKFDEARINKFIKISDLKIDGEGSNQASGGCIKAFGARNCQFERLRLEDGKDNGLWLTGNGATVGVGYYNRIISCELNNNLGNGSYETHTEANIFVNNVFAWNTDYGSYHYGGISYWEANHFDRNGVGVYIRGKTICKIIGNHFDVQQNEGVLIDEEEADANTITGNTFSNNGGAAANTYSDIKINSGGDYNVIANNTFTGSGTKYAVEETAGCNYNIIEGNAFAGTYGTDEIYIVGANTKVYGNYGDSAIVRGDEKVVCASNAPDTNQCDYLCDGTADEVQINLALTAGNNVVLSKGDFTVAASILMGDNDWLHGQGIGTDIGLVNSGNTHIISTTGAANIYFVHISDMRIDGNKANNTSGYGIYMRYAHTWLVENLHIKDTEDEGIVLAGNSDPIYALNNVIKNCRVENTGNSCIHIAGYAPNNHLISNIVGGNDLEYGIKIENAENVVIDHHIHSTTSHGIYNISSNNIITSNFIEASGASGLYCSSTASGGTITGNMIFNSTDDGLRIDGEKMTITGNRCFDNQGSKTQDYGLNLQSNSNDNYVMNNMLEGNDTGTFTNAGTDNELMINDGDNVIRNMLEISKAVDGEFEGLRLWNRNTSGGWSPYTKMSFGYHTTYTEGAYLKFQYNLGGNADSRFTINSDNRIILEANETTTTGKEISTVDADTIADSGDGNPATATLQPATSYVSLTCNDADTCDITMSETSTTDGQIVRITNVSANACDFADTAGVSELAGVFAMGQYDTLELLYATDRWVEISRSNN